MLSITQLLQQVRVPEFLFNPGLTTLKQLLKRNWKMKPHQTDNKMSLFMANKKKVLMLFMILMF